MKNGHVLKHIPTSNPVGKNTKGLVINNKINGNKTNEEDTPLIIANKMNDLCTFDTQHKFVDKRNTPHALGHSGTDVKIVINKKSYVKLMESGT